MDGWMLEWMVVYTHIIMWIDRKSKHAPAQRIKPETQAAHVHQLVCHSTVFRLVVLLCISIFYLTLIWQIIFDPILIFVYNSAIARCLLPMVAFALLPFRFFFFALFIWSFNDANEFTQSINWDMFRCTLSISYTFTRFRSQKIVAVLSPWPSSWSALCIIISIIIQKVKTYLQFPSNFKLVSFIIHSNLNENTQFHFNSFCPVSFRLVLRTYIVNSEIYRRFVHVSLQDSVLFAWVWIINYSSKRISGYI